MSILNKKSLSFLEKYLNNASPTGYEITGQKVWMDYLNPYVDNFITDISILNNVNKQWFKKMRIVITLTAILPLLYNLFINKINKI